MYTIPEIELAFEKAGADYNKQTLNVTRVLLINLELEEKQKAIKSLTTANNNAVKGLAIVKAFMDNAPGENKNGN